MNSFLGKKRTVEREAEANVLCVNEEISQRESVTLFPLLPAIIINLLTSLSLRIVSIQICIRVYDAGVSPATFAMSR